MNINEMILLSRAVDSTLEIPSPAGLAYHPFQKAGIEYGSLCKSHILIGDEPGLGKTIQAIGLMNLYGDNQAFVVCPASLLYNWKKELETWLVKKATIEIFHPLKENKADIILMSYYWFQKPYFKFLRALGKKKYLILDEVHKLKNPKASRTKYVLAADGFRAQSERVICLSGTPMEKQPIELYPIIRALKPALIGNKDYFGYGLKYCAGWKTPWGSWDFTGASDLKELGTCLRADFMVRRLKKHVLKDLPDKIRNFVYLEETKDAKVNIQKIVSYENEVIKGARTYNFTELSAELKALGVSKISPAIQYIKDQFEGGHEKIIVFCHHKEVLNAILEGLKEFNPVKIDGDVSLEKRNQAVEKFQNDKDSRVFGGTIGAAGVGLTLTASSYVIMVEYSYKPGENEQCEDRAHRIGQKDSVLVDYLVYANSPDIKKLKLILKRDKDIKEFGE